jgi:hypothetical protein
MFSEQAQRALLSHTTRTGQRSWQPTSSPLKWTRHGLLTYYTAFVIELHSRRVHVPGTTRTRTTPS